MVIPKEVVGNNIRNLKTSLPQLFQFKPVAGRFHPERAFQREQTFHLSLTKCATLLMQCTQMQKYVVTELVKRDIIRCPLAYTHQSYLRPYNLKQIICNFRNRTVELPSLGKIHADCCYTC